MNPLRPVSFAAAAAAVSLFAWSAHAPACDQNQAKGAAASSAAYSAAAGTDCSAKMAAGCTASMAASCPMHGKATAVTASTKMAAHAGCCGGTGASATTAMKTGPSAQAIDADFAGCSAHKNAAVAAGGTCPYAAKMAGATCPHAAATATAAAGCAHGAQDAVMAEAPGAGCGGRGMLRTSGQAVHEDCEACVDMQECEAALRKLGASMQVVSLKNGVMYIYTADQAHMRGVQQALAHRRDQMALYASANATPHLCPDCRQMRGAAMSGKLTTDVVDVDGRCLALMTSSDPAIVARIHALAGLSTMARAKL